MCGRAYRSSGRLPLLGGTKSWCSTQVYPAAFHWTCIPGVRPDERVSDGCALFSFKVKGVHGPCPHRASVSTGIAAMEHSTPRRMHWCVMMLDTAWHAARRNETGWRAAIYRACVSVDVACTGGASLSALLGALLHELEGLHPAAGKLAQPRRHEQNRTAWLGAAPEAWFWFQFVVAVGWGHSVAWVNEAIYIGVTALAVGVVGRYVLVRPCRSYSQSAWRALLFLGGAIAASGLPLDAHLCNTLGASFTHVNMLFLGCDVIMLALLGYVAVELQAAMANVRKRG